MTNDEIVARGMKAARYLADEELMSFFDEMKGDIQTSLFHTTAIQHEERERLYFQHRGIEDVLDAMNAYKGRAEDIIEGRQRIINNFQDDY